MPSSWAPHHGPRVIAGAALPEERLAAVAELGDTLWLVPANPAQEDGGVAPRPVMSSGSLAPLDAKLARAYHSFCDEVLWPVMNALPTLLPLSFEGWQQFRSVNQAVADLVTANYRPGDFVLVQDHHLALVPAMVRSLIGDARIALSLHHPFPSPEVLRVLPFWSELLHGMLGADLLTFRDPRYAGRFLQTALESPTAAVAEGSGLRWNSRLVRVEALPLGVNVRGLERQARSPEVERLSRLLAPARSAAKATVRTLLALDRSDRNGGVPRLLAAFERLLQQHPELRENVRLLQIMIPATAVGPGHRDDEREVQARVGRINGVFGTTRWTPVHYIRRRPSTDEALALYRKSDIMLVTSLGERPDQVAHEFVASRFDGDGVLVLSDRCADADSLAGAVVMNPFDVAGAAQALAAALTLDEAERRRRMTFLRGAALAGDSRHWASRVKQPLVARDDTAARQRAPEILDVEIRTTMERARCARPLLLLLDYDGTLVPFAARPELAAPDPELLALLESLCARPHTEVHVVSGRSRASLLSFFGDLPRLGLHAEHGVWSRDAGGLDHERPTPPSLWRSGALDLMRQFCQEVPGSLLEEKASGLAWHYRRADLRGLHAVRELSRQLQSLIEDLPAQILLGDKVLEVRPRGIHKGLVAAEVQARHPGAFVIAAGDDLTDEDMFASLAPGALTVEVGMRAIGAKHRLPGPRALRELLWKLAERGWRVATATPECHISTMERMTQ